MDQLLDRSQEIRRAPSEPGDHEKFSHYVLKEEILRATIEGGLAEALCGKLWTPTRDPSGFPVCQECKEIYEEMQP